MGAIVFGAPGRTRPGREVTPAVALSYSPATGPQGLRPRSQLRWTFG